MEQQTNFRFTDDELNTLERALALYAAYTREMEVDMLVGDESDSEAVMANHNRAKTMHRQFFNLTHDQSYEGERMSFEQRHGRPMDVCDFSDFDWYTYVQGGLNR